jgi:hypothetical protein
MELEPEPERDETPDSAPTAYKGFHGSISYVTVTFVRWLNF